MPIPLPPIDRDVTSDKTDRVHQHWVPESYLRQWCDPATPQGAYVWVSLKDRSRRPCRGSPKRMFTKSDMNTMTRDGLRNLRLESIYHAMETGFGAVRARILSGAQPTHGDIDAVIEFVASQIVRTPKFQGSWRFLDPSELAATVAGLPDGEARRAVGECLAGLWAKRFQALCLLAYPRVLELVQQMRVRLYRSAEPRAFITSDAPCCIIEYRDVAGSMLSCLASPTVRVLMPLSPDVVAILDRSDRPREMTQVFPGHPFIGSVNSMVWDGAVREVVLPDSAVPADWFGTRNSEERRRFIAL